jgi:BlaI family penicillinase repressor
MAAESVRISAAESVIMEALWKRRPLSAEDIVADVASEQGWTDATVKTLINRLLTKEAISAERDGRRYLYSPKLERADYVSEESRNLIDRLFEGRLSSLVTHFSEREQLSADDIAELKRLIQDLDNER